MSYIRHLYYNLSIIKTNIIINLFLIGNLIVPKYFNKNILYYKNINDTNYKYIILISLNDEIEEKYNIDMLSIGMKIYDKYQLYINKKDDDSLSDISDLSDLSYSSESSECINVY